MLYQTSLIYATALLKLLRKTGQRQVRVGICIILICTNYFSEAQTIITGSVSDSLNHAAIPNCSVFISNTTIGTITNPDGSFKLSVPDRGFDLVVSSIGYETQVYTFKAGIVQQNLLIHLPRKQEALNAVVVEPYEKNGWNKWGKTFLDDFIGTTENAKNCRILNRNVIHFRYSKKYNRLIATADDILQIENPSLGYVINYKLEKFDCNFSSQITYFLGYSLFREMKFGARRQKRIQEQRDKAYLESVEHFMQSLYAHEISQQRFSIVKTIHVVNKEKQRVKDIMRNAAPAADTFDMQNGKMVKRKSNVQTDSLGYYHEIMKEQDSLERDALISEDSLLSPGSDGLKLLSFKGTLEVVYRATQQNLVSTITLETDDPLQIDKDGNYYPPAELLTGGFWGLHQKIANQLPLDYRISAK